MPETLAIVERAHRGAVEQQYAHVLWLLHGLHRQTAMTVVLRGTATLYALEADRPDAIDLAGVAVPQPDYAEAIDRLLSDGADVYVEQQSLLRFGLDAHTVRKGVRVLPPGALVELCECHERIWYV